MEVMIGFGKQVNHKELLKGIRYKFDNSCYFIITIFKIFYVI